jgi:TonB family protein
MSPWLRLVAAIALSSSAWGQTAPAETAERSTDFRRYITTRYDPFYPREAREQRLAGVGSALIKIDPRTGLVKSVTLLKSTGHDILDREAIHAYRRWQFIPHTISEAEVPIIFTTAGAVDPTWKPSSAPMTKPKTPVINMPRPEYPYEARSQHWGGAGVVVVKVDQRTGLVTDAWMEKSIGHKILDDAALKAFRRWRFKPGTPSKVRIPIRYTMSGATY